MDLTAQAPTRATASEALITEWGVATSAGGLIRQQHSLAEGSGPSPALQQEHSREGASAGNKACPAQSAAFLNEMPRRKAAPGKGSRATLGPRPKDPPAPALARTSLEATGEGALQAQPPETGAPLHPPGPRPHPETCQGWAHRPSCCASQGSSVYTVAFCTPPARPPAAGPRPNTPHRTPLPGPGAPLRPPAPAP